MFGFKKTIPADEFALGVYKYSGEFMDNDMARSLAMRFDGVDLSNGPSNFLNRKEFQ